MEHHNSSIGSLDILETEDTSLLVLSREIDDHTSSMRNSVLHSIASIRNRIHQQAAEIMDRHREASSATERKLMQQIGNLQDLLAKKEHDLAYERTLNERLVTMVQRQKRRHATQGLAVEAIRAWRSIVREKKQHQRLSDYLGQQRKDKEARTVFSAWRLEAFRQKSDAAAEKVANDTRRQVAKQQQDSQSTENKLKLEILGWREKLAKEEEHRGLLEEKLKAAFMRGVCALNLEAMQVLRHAADADVSVASLLQGMNVTMNSSEDAVNATRGLNSTTAGGVGGGSAADRLLQQQAALNDQLSALHVNTSRAPEPEEVPCYVAGGGGGRPASTGGSHQPFVVNVNPRYPRGVATPAATAGKRTATATTKR